MPAIVHHAALTVGGSGEAIRNRRHSDGKTSRTSVMPASSRSAATKNAAEAFVNHAPTTAAPAAKPTTGQRLDSAYADQLATMNAVIVDSISAARFHITNT